jgi:hypothetical protein
MIDILLALIELFWWPYEAWKHSTESSRIGVSPDEKKTLQFWYAVGMTFTICAVVLMLIISVPLYLLSH